MQNNNIAIADELDEIASILARAVYEDEISDSLANIESEIAYLDSIAKKADVSELRALSHWMMLNIEVTPENERLIYGLLEQGSYHNWMTVLAKILRQYDQALLPKIYQALTDPDWLIKPSAPLLCNLASWIEQTKNTSAAQINNDASVKKTEDEVVPENPHIFEDAEIDFFEENYDNTDIINDFNDALSIDNSSSLTEKTTNDYDDVTEKSLEDEIIHSTIEDYSQADLDTLLEEIEVETIILEEEQYIEAPIEPTSDLDDAITQQTTTEITTQLDSQAVDIQDDLNLSNDAVIELTEENTVKTEYINTETSELNIEAKTNDFSDEADDIVMTLTSISASSHNVFEDTDKFISELQRFDMLVEISGYAKVLPISAWCQQNITLFSENQSDESRSFIESGESWMWIEHTKLALAEPEEISHIAELSSELSREEWLEPLAIDYLQEFLLFLRNPNTNDSAPEITEETKPEIATIDTSVVNNATELSLIWDKDVHPELLEVYFEETEENIKELSTYLKSIDSKQTTKEQRQDARRTAHTIKGGSAVVGITALSTFAHKLEIILDHAIDHQLNNETNELLINASSCLKDLLKSIQEKTKAPVSFSLSLSKLTHLAESLEDQNNEVIELTAPVLPDFITQQNDIIVDNSIKKEKPVEPLENTSTIEKKEEPIAITEETELSLPILDDSDDLSDFTAELDDIVMTLVTTEVKADKKPFNLEPYIEELQRLDMLAEISGFPEVVKISNWYQENLKLISKKSTKKLGLFISSGESWAWLELISACLSNPEEGTHLSSLCSELTRTEWPKALEETDLQTLLLALKGQSSKEIDDVVLKLSSKTSKEADSKSKKKPKATKKSKAKKVAGKKVATKAATKKKTKKPIKSVVKKKTVSKKATTNKKPLKKPTQKPKKHSEVNITSWDEDVHPELLSVYLQETSEQVTKVANLLHKISKNEANKEQQEQAARIAHTIKGASGVVGVTELVDFTHKLEDILDFAVNNKIPNETAELLSEASDCLESTFEAVQAKKAIPDEFKPVLAKLATYAASIENTNSAVNDSIKLDMPELPDFITHNKKSKKKTKAKTKQALSLKTDNDPATESHIRVPTTLINKLLNLAGELVTTSSQVSDKVENTLITSTQIKDQDKRVHNMLDELTTTIHKQEKDQMTMLSNMQNNSFDTLEMDTYNELHSVTGLLTESILDSETIESTLKQQLKEIHDDLRTLDNLNKELSETILSSRMESLNALIPRLERIVRQTCRKTKKKAELIVTGNDINIDTEILTGLADPLLHLLRNAVDHGIETPKARKSIKKDESGKITLDFSRQGNFIHLQLQDDGAGIDSEKVYQHAIDKGMITPDQEFSKNEILKLILQAGFSTQENVNDISGRGVGMDVVNKSIEKLKGSLTINSEVDKGTTIDIKIPLTLVTSSTLLVSTAGNQVAIPTDSIDQLFYLAPEDVLIRGKDHYIRHDGKEIIIQSLAAILGWQAEAVGFSHAQTLVLVKGEKELHAVYIDKIIHSREVVIKSLSHFINDAEGVIGACHLTDGAVAPVLNLSQLLSLNEKSKNTIKKLDTSNLDTSNVLGTLQILVVDDSLSNRKALSLIIEKTEYDVTTAVDGLDALNIMNEKHIDLVFTDLEMPRMTGLELTQAIRAWDEKKQTPIVMITSRSTNKHRELAEKAGVDDYLTKPVATETLLASMEKWLKQAALA